MFLYLLLFVIIVSIIYYNYRKFSYWKNKNVTGPKPIPVFGNFEEVALRRKHEGMFYWDIYKQYPEEKVVGLYRMTCPTLLIRDLDVVKEILIKHFEAFTDRGTFFSETGLGQNILHSDPDTWRFLRRQFTSLYTITKLKGSVLLLDKYGDKFLDYIQTTTVEGPEHDIYQLVLKYAVGTTMLGIFGLNIELFNNQSRLFEIMDEKLVNTYFIEIGLMFPAILKKINTSIIRKEMVKFSHEILEAGEKHTISNKGVNTLMDVLMKLKKANDIDTSKENTDSSQQSFTNITDELLAAQCWFFYAAGYGNNALTLTYAMYYLDRNPDVQEKLRGEINEVIRKYKGVLQYDAVKEMKYLDMVFHETLRMHPTTNSVVRSANRDIKLQGLNFTIDKGTVVVMSPFSFQHDEKYYPAPDKFNPARFTPENIKDRHTCAFLSFGRGPRSCLGMQFATIQFGICLSKVLLKFRVEVSDNTIRSIDYNARRMLLTPNQKIRLNLLPL